LQVLKEQGEHTKAETATAQAKITELSGALQVKEARIQELTAEVQAAQRQLVEGDQTSVVEGLQTEISGLRVSLSQHEEEKAGVAEKARQGEEEIQRLTALTEENAKGTKTQAEENARLQKRAADLEKETAEWEIRLEEARVEDEGFNTAIQKVNSSWCAITFARIHPPSLLTVERAADSTVRRSEKAACRRASGRRGTQEGDSNVERGST